MNEECGVCFSASASGSSSFSWMQGWVPLYFSRTPLLLLRCLCFVSATLFLVTFHFGGFLLLLLLLRRFLLLSRWSLSPLYSFFSFFFDDESLALVSRCTTAAGGNKLFCFSFNEHVFEKKKHYTQFCMHFFLRLLLGGQFLPSYPVVPVGRSHTSLDIFQNAAAFDTARCSTMQLIAVR